MLGRRVRWRRQAATLHKGSAALIVMVACGLALVPLKAQEPVQAATSPLPEAPSPGPVSAGDPPAAASPAMTDAPAANLPATMSAPPLAIVPLDSSVTGAASSVTGSMQAWNGRAFISNNGEITAGGSSAQVTLPYRGTLNVCPSTSVKLSADPNVPISEVPGMLIALDAGAVEAHFSVAKNADVVMTPDLRILVSGSGPADVKIRLGDNGDTCVDNSGANAPYVVVTSQFDSGLYRVQPGQRVVFQHGDLQNVSSQPQQPCGCPVPADKKNIFPIEQSQGLAPLAQPPAYVVKGGEASQSSEVLSYNGTARSFANGTSKPTPSMHAMNTMTNPPLPTPQGRNQGPVQKKKFLAKVGHFFKVFFGADS